MDEGKGEVPATLPLYTLKDLNLLGLRQNLKKRDSPYLYLIRKDNRLTLEADLINRSYKGVTDLVTKWLWPHPAFSVVRFCVRFGLQPKSNYVLSWCLSSRARRSDIATMACVSCWDG
jgi:hypothetical protein